jgi:competence protein ComEC
MITERNGNKVTLYANDSIRRASQNNVLKSYLTANFSALTAKQIKNIAFFNEERILILDGTYSKTFILPLFYSTQSLK